MTAFEVTFEIARRCRQLLTAVGLLAAGLAAAAPAASDLVGSWAVRLPGEPVERTFRVMRVEETGQGLPRVVAQFGLRGERVAPIAVEVSRVNAVLTFRFTTIRGATFDVVLSDDDSLRGQVTAPSGAVREVRFSRMAPGEDTATSAALYIVKPGPDVPAHCAAFSGLWEGEWLFGARGRAWIWVLEVDTTCQAKVAMQRELKRPVGFRLVQIDGGVAVIPGANGSDVYRRWGDELHGAATLFHFDTVNRVAFKRIADTLP